MNKTIEDIKKELEYKKIKLREDKEELERLISRIRELESSLQISSYISLMSQIRLLNATIQGEEDEVLWLTMLSCDHIMYYKGTINERKIYKCVLCGLTNENAHLLGNGFPESFRIDTKLYYERFPNEEPDVIMSSEILSDDDARELYEDAVCFIGNDKKAILEEIRISQYESRVLREVRVLLKGKK